MTTTQAELDAFRKLVRELDLRTLKSIEYVLSRTCHDLNQWMVGRQTAAIILPAIKPLCEYAKIASGEQLRRTREEA